MMRWLRKLFTWPTNPYPKPVEECDGGYTCPATVHIEGCLRPHADQEARRDW